MQASNLDEIRLMQQEIGWKYCKKILYGLVDNSQTEKGKFGDNFKTYANLFHVICAYNRAKNEHKNTSKQQFKFLKLAISQFLTCR